MAGEQRGPSVVDGAGVWMDVRKRKGEPERARPVSDRTGLSRDYVAGSQAFRTLHDCKLNTLSFVERLVSVGLDG